MFYHSAPTVTMAFGVKEYYATNPDNLLKSAANEDILAQISKNEPSSNLNL